MLGVGADFVLEADKSEEGVFAVGFLDESEGAVGVGGEFDLFYDCFVICDKINGAEEIGGGFAPDAGVFTIRGEIDDFGDFV